MKKSKKMDRKLVSSETHEIAYLAKKLRTTRAVIRAAHAAVGRSRKLVEAFVLGHKVA
jgi:CMP-N-acetylneuraminic acid synthetase